MRQFLEGVVIIIVGFGAVFPAAFLLTGTSRPALCAGLLASLSWLEGALMTDYWRLNDWK